MIFKYNTKKIKKIKKSIIIKVLISPILEIYLPF